MAVFKRSAERSRGRTGFTLLEVLVATAIMGIAVAGLLSNLTTSVSNAARLVDSDRAAFMARRKMDELLVERRLPLNTEVTGMFPPELAGGLEAGWRARLIPLEFRAAPAPGQPMLQSIQLEVWWVKSRRRRTLQIEAFRIGVLRPEQIEGARNAPSGGARP
jgi:general secretion pathway protein I